MVGLNSHSIVLPAQVPTQVPEELYTPINDLYVALSLLLKFVDGAYPALQSPNGHWWVPNINNSGVLTWTDVGTTRP